VAADRVAKRSELCHHHECVVGVAGLAGCREGDVGGAGGHGRLLAGSVYLLEDCLNVILVNASHAKGLPGRKTDVSDAAWLCQLGECGLLKASFVPLEPIRQLRDLTRYRATLAAERTREAQRLEKELEDAGIKLSSVATDILGVSGRAMLTALIEGERDVHVLAEMAKARNAAQDPPAGGGVDRELRAAPCLPVPPPSPAH
jgi:transposase